MVRLPRGGVMVFADRPFPRWELRRVIYVILLLWGIGSYIAYLIARAPTYGRGPGDRTSWTFLIMGCLAMGLFFGLAFIYGELSIMADRDQIQLKKWLRLDVRWHDWQPPITVARKDIGRVVLLSVDTVKGTSTTRKPAVFVLDDAGRCVISLLPCPFRAEDLAEVW